MENSKLFFYAFVGKGAILASLLSVGRELTGKKIVDFSSEVNVWYDWVILFILTGLGLCAIYFLTLALVAIIFPDTPKWLVKIFLKNFPQKL